MDSGTSTQTQLDDLRSTPTLEELYQKLDKVDFTHMSAVINAAAKAARLLIDGPSPQWKPGGRPCRQGEAPQPNVCS